MSGMRPNTMQAPGTLGEHLPIPSWSPAFLPNPKLLEAPAGTSKALTTQGPGATFGQTHGSGVNTECVLSGGRRSGVARRTFILCGAWKCA